MKSAKLLNVFVLGVLLATFAAGCKKQPKNITTIPGREVRLGGDGMNPAITPGGTLGDGGANSRNLGAGELPEPREGDQDRAALASQTVYFDFDRSAICPN